MSQWAEFQTSVAWTLRACYKRLQMTVVGLDKLIFIKLLNDQTLLNSWKETLICCESDVSMKNFFQRLCTMLVIRKLVTDAPNLEEPGGL